MYATLTISPAASITILSTITSGCNSMKALNNQNAIANTSTKDDAQIEF